MFFDVLRDSLQHLRARVLYADTSHTGRAAIYAWDCATDSQIHLCDIPARLFDEDRGLEFSSQGSFAYCGRTSSGTDQLHVVSSRRHRVLDAPGHDVGYWGWTSDSGAILRRREGFPEFHLSSNGTSLVVMWDQIYAYSDSGNGTKWFTQSMSSLAVDDSSFQTVRVDTFHSSGLNSDRGWSWRFKSWDLANPRRILLCKFYPGQLHSEERELWRYDIDQRAYALLSPDFASAMSFSPDGQSALEEPNDETCCDGTNYTNNCVVLVHLSTWERRTLHDEYATFGNDNKPEEHMPQSAGLSPDNQWAAIGLSDYYDWIRKANAPEDLPDGVRDSITVDYQVLVISAGGGTRWEIPDSRLVGWIDARRLLVQEDLEVLKDGDREHTGGRFKVVDIVDRSARFPLPKGIKIIGIQWATH